MSKVTGTRPSDPRRHSVHLYPARGPSHQAATFVPQQRASSSHQHETCLSAERTSSSRWASSELEVASLLIKMGGRVSSDGFYCSSPPSRPDTGHQNFHHQGSLIQARHVGLPSVLQYSPSRPQPRHQKSHQISPVVARHAGLPSVLLSSPPAGFARVARPLRPKGSRSRHQVSRLSSTHTVVPSLPRKSSKMTIRQVYHDLQQDHSYSLPQVIRDSRNLLLTNPANVLLSVHKQQVVHPDSWLTDHASHCDYDTHSESSSLDSEGTKSTKPAPRRPTQQIKGAVKRLHKPQVCVECGVLRSSATSMKLHMLTHTQARPYICDTCGKGFNQRSTLRTHRRLHTGEKPYVCESNNCGRKFSDYSCFHKHKRTHTGEKPYSCSKCEKSFTQSGNMWRHEKSCYNVKPVK